MIANCTRRIAAPLVLIAALLVTGGSPGAAEEDPPPPEVPVRLTANVDATDAADLGLWRLKVEFAVEEDVGRPYRVQLRLVRRGEVVADLDHSPRPPVTSWKKGQRVGYEVPVPVPQEAGLVPGTEVELRLGFFDPERDRVVPFRTEEQLRGGLLPLATLTMPAAAPTDGEERIAQIVARAETLARAGRKPDAWRLLETALRRAAEDPTKRRYRDALMKLGSLEAEPPSLLEQEVIAQRIAAERLRYLREVSGRQFDMGRLFAALRLLEVVGGTLAEQTGAAVLGALADAKRAEKDIVDLKVRILGQVSDDDKEQAQKALEQLGTGAPLLAKARGWAGEKQYAKARILLRTLALGGDAALAGEARRLKDELESTWLSDTPPAEAQIVDEAKNHPAFDRLGTVPSQKFLFLGPKNLVESIPPDSRLRFDLCHVFLTDLFGRLPNPSGDRITVYFKELWDFGGGQGGGKIIDIGRANPGAHGTRVDTGLLYHELTHCVDDTDPIYAGFREGLANFGAAFAFEALGQEGDTQHAFAANLEAFRRDYVGRDLPYWRIQDYGPSAGFFLHFVDTYARAPWGHDWAPYRRFFRAYRATSVADGREPYVARALAHHLVQAFGPRAFDDLLTFRFPLVESDRGALTTELEAFAKGDAEVLRHAAELGAAPNSPLWRDLLARRMLSVPSSSARDEEVRALGRELGVLYDWRVIGPFRSPHADPRARVFPPEEEVDFAKEYDDGLNTCRWRTPGKEGVVTIDALGWVAFNSSYMDDTATYALTSLTVERETEAFVHLRADDDVALFLNDRRVEGYVRRHEGGGRLWWRGPAAPMPDAMRFPVVLPAGRSKLLLKVKNRYGPAGFVLAVSRRDGRAIEGLRVDAEAAPASTGSVPAKPAWRETFDHTFRAKAFEPHVDVAVGRFKVVNKRLQGEATDQRVSWRKYTVRPGFPADAPSNLLWLKEKASEGLGAFRLEVTLVPPANEAPKVALTFQGDGGTDGLGGWTLIIHQGGPKRVAAQLERYEDLAYQTSPLDLTPALLAAEEQALLLTYFDGRLTVTLGDLVLFRNVSLQAIPGRHRIGLATWGASPAIAAIRLERAVPTK